jgi:aminoglycoside 3-N-acetyltransferase
VISFREIVTGLRKLEINRTCPVIVHASLSAFGEVQGGVETLLGSLGSSFNTIVVPVFTYKTMIIPEVGPPDNAMRYGSGKDLNRLAEIFYPDMPADPLMGALAEGVRRHPKASRSPHPILSFAGINARKILDGQSIKEPLLPIQTLRDEGGWVLLLGVDHTVNTSIHYGEQLAGRKQFIRWALTTKGIIPCHKFPGCSAGFEALSPQLEVSLRQVEIGEATVKAFPLSDLLDAVVELLKQDALALLCDREDCERCDAVRVAIAQ